MRTLVHNFHKSIIDHLGMAASLLCLLHCALTPLLILFLPTLDFTDSWWTHFILAIGVGAFAILAFQRGYQHHHKLLPVTLGFAGLTLIILALFIDSEPHSGIDLEHILPTVAGSILLVCGHALNMHSCNCGKVAKFTHNELVTRIGAIR